MTHTHKGTECESTGDLVCACGMRNTLCDDDPNFDGGWFTPRSAGAQKAINNIQNEGYSDGPMPTDQVQD